MSDHIRPPRPIVSSELRDAVDEVMVVVLDDAELAARGITLEHEEVLVYGLGSGGGALIELPSGMQVLLRRFDASPEEVCVSAALPLPIDVIVQGIQDGLAIPAERITWTKEEQHWNAFRATYDREAWLVRRERLASSPPDEP